MSNDQPITNLVRSDRVGIRSRTGVGAKPWGWLATSISYGDLWLTESNEMGFAKVKWYDQDWRTHVISVPCFGLSGQSCPAGTFDEAGVLDLLQAVPDDLDQVSEAGDGEVGQHAALEH